MDVGGWLRGIGLGQYVELFRDNDIDGDVLRQLTGDDLKELGVTSFGHRKKLLDAIALLATGPATASGGAGARRQAERRQLTVMFVDLVGSTAMAARVDPEAMSEVLGVYQRTVHATVTRLDGHVAKFMGDGVLAYFGWPMAHEDEAERAVRAGLAIVGEVARLSVLGEPTSCRIGIATGLVVVGDLVGEGASQEEAVVGETPNLAARLQTLAAPGQVVIAEGTRRLLGEIFDLRTLPPQEVKGIAAPVRAFVVDGERSSDSRFTARAGYRPLPIVGRDQELVLVMERWRLAKAGEGQVVLLTGEAGIGKSRIVAALLEALGQESHVTIRNQCSPYHTDSSLRPVIQHLALAAGFMPDDSAEGRLDKLEALMGTDAPQSREAAALVAELMGLDPNTRYGQPELTAQQRRYRTLQILVDQLIGLGTVNPVLWIIEDGHWIDPTTLELVELALDRLARARVLLLMTARPTFRHRFGGHPIVTRLALNRLGRNQTAAIMARISDGKALPQGLVDEITLRTDGIPLYVEEMTKAVLESGTLRETPDSWQLDGPVNRLPIPTSLHGSLMARLDRLQPIKEVAQIAAVIGRDFDYRTLATVSGLDDVALRDALEQLVGAELIFRRGEPPDASYTFKHALVRDAAYESLLMRRRQDVHGRVLDVMLADTRQIEAQHPELLALHATEAGRIDIACRYWLAAGERATQRAALTEANAHLSRGLDLARTLPDGDPKRRHELALWVAMGQSLIPARGFAAAETFAAYGRARELCHELGDTAHLLSVLYGTYVSHFQRAELAAAQDVAEALLQHGADHGDPVASMIGYRSRCSVAFQLGRFLAVQDDGLRGLQLYEQTRGNIPIGRFAVDSRIVFLSWMAQAAAITGRRDEARRLVSDMLQCARDLRHAPSMSLSLSRASAFHRFCGETDAVAELAHAQIAIAAQHGFAQDLAGGRFDIAWAQSRHGATDEHVAAMREAIDAYRGTGAFLGVPAQLADLADAVADAREPAEGMRLIDEAMGQAGASGEHWYDAELLRRRGRLRERMSGGDPSPAVADYSAAFERAKEQNAELWALRAASDLARAWHARGAGDGARQLLTATVGGFAADSVDPDLILARNLLDQLGRPPQC